MARQIKNKLEALGIENIIIEIKNSVCKLNSKLDITEKIAEVEDRASGII